MSKDGTYLISRWNWLFRQFGKRIWVRATMFSVAAVAVSLLAAVAGPYVPTTWELSLAAGSVDNILTILASSMLAVTTFSLSIMVNAYAAASSSVTPRATNLLITDSVATNTLSTFIGSFLFAIVGIIGLSAGLYGSRGRIILFFATLIVVFMVTAALLRWIEELGHFGRVGDGIRRVEKEAKRAAVNWGRLPRLGAQPSQDIPEQAAPLYVQRAGYISHIDMRALEEVAQREDAEIHIVSLPGGFVHPNRAVAYVHPELGADNRDDAVHCFTVSAARSYDQDPRYGLIILSEIASRALSPAVNDPGTAIAVLASGVRTFYAYAEGHEEAEKSRFGRLYAPDVSIGAMMEEFFNPIARDGAALIEVQLRLQSSLEAIALANLSLFGDSAKLQAGQALEHALAANHTERERERLREASEWKLAS